MRALFLFVPKYNGEASQLSTLPKRKASNAKQKRETPKFSRREKRILSAVGIANPSAAAAKCILTAGEAFPNATIELVADPVQFEVDNFPRLRFPPSQFLLDTPAATFPPASEKRPCARL